MKCFSFLRAVLLLSLFACGVSFAQKWQGMKNPANHWIPTPFLLTDGTVLFHEDSTPLWFKLTPDANGSYVDGTWTQIASLPNGYGPDAFASAVLADGRFVIIGGEYNLNVSGNFSMGAIYDPKSDTWTPITRPQFQNDTVGDAPSVVLPNGQFAVGDIFGQGLGYLDPVTLTWTLPATTGKPDYTDEDEEGFTLLPDGTFLDVNVANAPVTQRYLPSLHQWISAGSTPTFMSDGNGEMGPAVLRPDGTVFATGASGTNAVYTPPSTLMGPGTWTAAPSFPVVAGEGQLDVADGPACLLTDGNVLVAASHGYGQTPVHFFEFDGTRLNEVPATPDAAGQSSEWGKLLTLPTGQALWSDGTPYIYTPAGTANPAWAPTISQFPAVVGRGGTYPISGTQFNGLSQASAYGDDYQAATNWPLVRITNQATGHVFYARTHDHSTMAVATGHTPVSTNFDVPPSIELGASTLVVVANGIASSPVAITIETLKPTSVSLTSSLNPSSSAHAVTFTASVAGAGSIPSGTVTFLDGFTRLGTGTLTSNGVATFSTSTLIVGAHSITASYSGDSTFASSVSGALTQTVNGTTPQLSLASSINPSTFGADAILTVAVTGAGAVPTGTILFYENDAWFDSETLSAGKAMWESFGNLVVGSHVITAKYLGDANHAPTSSVLTQVVNPATTVTSLTSSGSISSQGQGVTFTVNVASIVTPSGTVLLEDGTTQLASLTLNSTGSGIDSSATFQTSALSPGQHAITARFVGNSNQLTSSSSVLNHVVSSNLSSVSLSSSLNPSVEGQAVVFRATVTTSPGIAPTGSVNFLDGTTSLGTQTLTAGVATLSVSSLAGGSHSITAHYSGDATYTGSGSNVVSQVVGPGPSSVSLTSSLNPSMISRTITFTATVAHTGVATPTGNVTFYDGAKSLGSSTVSTTGAATFSAATLSFGSHSIQALYSGDTNYSSGSSSVLSEVVNYRPSAVALSSSADPSVYGQPVELTAKVTSTAGGTITGSVTFLDGTTAIGSATLKLGVATLSVGTLSIGSHSITAQYGGAHAFSGSTSSPMSQVVTLKPTSVSLKSSPNPSMTGQAVTFTATVTSSAGGTPTGTVTFSAGTASTPPQPLIGGVATFTWKIPWAGNYPITAQYSGDATNSTSTSDVDIQVVNPLP